MISRLSLKSRTRTELPAALALLLFLAAMMGGCAPVQPWERGRLAQANMALSADPLQDAMDEHVYDSKEASSGGIGAAGGGCGCN